MLEQSTSSFRGAESSVVNKDWILKAKYWTFKAKDWTFKDKNWTLEAKAKYWTFKTKDKAKDWTFKAKNWTLKAKDKDLEHVFKEVQDKDKGQGQEHWQNHAVIDYTIENSSIDRTAAWPVVTCYIQTPGFLYKAVQFFSVSG